ncbi:translation elongation factor [Aureococcus anophagefferens]|uniref:Translation elongation factor n=1 Tax=Aureococcus anophagefferens TaxID=44056 RepID=A0ABR1FYN4_AURAN
MGLSTVEEVDAFMLTHSYVSGYAFSPADVEVFGKISLPDAGKFPQAYRWYIHIAALTGVKCLALVAGSSGGAAPAPAPKAAKAAPKAPAPAPKAAEPAARGRRRRLLGRRRGADGGGEGRGRHKSSEEAKAKAMAKLAKKEDLEELFKKIKSTFVREGLKWSEVCKLEDVAFGVKKIICRGRHQQTMSMDAIIEEITEEAFADEVQSMTMTSMSLL